MKINGKRIWECAADLIWMLITVAGTDQERNNFICKVKPGTVTKVKLVTKIKKLNQLYFGTFVLASYSGSRDNR